MWGDSILFKHLTINGSFQLKSKHNDTFSDCSVCLPSLSPKSFEPPSSKEKVTTPHSLQNLESQNILSQIVRFAAGVWGNADKALNFDFFNVQGQFDQKKWVF